MLQKVDILKQATEPITDTEAVFVCLYSLLLEKIESEPKKGMVFSKGNPNQRKIHWMDLMKMSHMLEDFFIFRAETYKDQVCENCCNWESISEASPHMGNCVKRKNRIVHCLYHCKNWENKNE